MLRTPMRTARTDAAAHKGTVKRRARRAFSSRDMSQSTANANPRPAITRTEACERLMTANPTRPKRSRRFVVVRRSRKLNAINMSRMAAITSSSYCFTTTAYRMNGKPIANTKSATVGPTPVSTRSARRRKRIKLTMAHTKGKSLSANSLWPKIVTEQRSTSRNPSGATWSRGRGRVSRSASGRSRML